METNHEFDFAVSYAGPDQPFVTEVVSALKARGLTVFHAPDEQADMIGRNLLDYLHTIYLSKARYCLLFASKHYAERKWTNKVERPAAQERALDQDERYIIPIRLDDTRITGLSGNTLDIRKSTPRQIADLCVAVMLRDEEPAAVGGEEGKRDRLILRIKSFTELDTELLRQSFKAFSGWSVSNAGMIPVELRMPRFFMETLDAYESIAVSEAFKDIGSDTQKSFTQFLRMIRNDLFQELVRMPPYVIQQSQPHGAAAPVLNDAAIELIRRYALSKFIAATRCFISYQLKGFQGPPWKAQFADCSFIWSPRVMNGLPWLCRSEGTEKHLWFDSDIHEWGPGQFYEKVRIYRPSVLVIRQRDKRPTADEVLRFIAPQLLERELEGRWPSLLSLAFLYPDRMRVTYRNENVIEAHHFHEPHLSNFNWIEALPAIEAMRDEILQTGQGSREEICDALSLMSSADFALGDRKDILLEAHRELWDRLEGHNSKEQKRKNDGEGAP